MKLIRFILFVLLINAIISFVILLNFKLVFGTAEKTKNIIAKSDVYNVVAGGIREGIAKVNAETDQGNLMETLNEKVGADGIQILSEDLIDQLYALQNSTGPKTVVLHLSLLQSRLGSEIKLPADITYNLDKGQIPEFVFGNYYAVLGGSALSLVVLLLLYILLVGNNKKTKLKWLGVVFLFIAIEIGAIIALLYYFMPSLIDQLINGITIENQKLARGFTKSFDAILKQQQIFYFIEFAVTAFLAIAMMVISKAIKAVEKNIQATQNPAIIKN